MPFINVTERGPFGLRIPVGLLNPQGIPRYSDAEGRDTLYLGELGAVLHRPDAGFRGIAEHLTSEEATSWLREHDHPQVGPTQESDRP